jgi:hypothetical protein
VSALIANLSNADVQWHGTPIGLMPILSGAANQLLEMGYEAVPGLLNALSDPDKYVGAHVVLTKISGVQYQAFPAWNGLEVVLAADGTASIDPDQQPVLIRRWRSWYHAEPHPAALPPTD